MIYIKRYLFKGIFSIFATKNKERTIYGKDNMLRQ